MTFTLPEKAACQKLVELALAEDLGDAGDITSQTVIPVDLKGCAAFVARADGIVAGLPAAELVCKAVDSSLRFEATHQDGERTKAGERLAVVDGPMRSLLTAERTALNFLQRLSGIATLTAKYVEAVKDLPTKILDTRKTTPGWRLLEKYAVRCGGGHNHRMGLYDGVLIKDNHLAAMKGKLNIESVVAKVLESKGREFPLEIEVDSLEQLRNVLPIKPAMVLLDNMSLVDMRDAVELRDRLAPGVLLEASGGVTLATVRAIAETGVDRISVGALTHSAPAFDIALDYLPS